jgi:hypothetical protein
MARWRNDTDRESDKLGERSSPVTSRLTQIQNSLLASDQGCPERVQAEVKLIFQPSPSPIMADRQGEKVRKQNRERFTQDAHWPQVPSTRKNRYVISSDTKEEDNNILNIICPYPFPYRRTSVICSCFPTNFPPLRRHCLGWSPIICGETFERGFSITVFYRTSVVELQQWRQIRRCDDRLSLR